MLFYSDQLGVSRINRDKLVIFGKQEKNVLTKVMRGTHAYCSICYPPPLAPSKHIAVEVCWDMRAECPRRGEGKNCSAVDSSCRSSQHYWVTLLY